MASKPKTLLTFVTFSLLFNLSSSISDETITNSVETLSNSTFNSMSLTLPLISQSLISFLPSATLFTPPDTSFTLSSSSISGQPSLSLLQFHFCPRFYSFSDLQSLSYGAKIDTLLPNQPLTITSPVFDDDVSINGVKIKSSPVFNDGFFVIYEIDRFFDPNFTSDLSPTPDPAGLPECPTRGYGDGSYHDAINVLRSRGYSLMAGFLEVQLSQFYSNERVRVVTVFAFGDDVAREGQFGNFSEWGSVFLRHVVGCELTWGDMAALDDGFVLTTFFKGFMIEVTHSNHSESAYSLMLNRDVSVDIPELFRDDKIVVHGISGILGVPNNSDHVDDPQMSQGAAYSPVNHVEF